MHGHERLARRLFDAQLCGDLDSFLGCCHESVNYTFPGDNAVSGNYQGYEGMKLWWNRMGRTFTGLEFAITNVFVEGSEIAVEWDDWGSNTDGTSYRSWGMTRITVRDGAVWRMRSMQDTEKLAELFPRGSSEND